MADVALKWNSEAQAADIFLAGADLGGDDDLTTAVIISLFTWRRARPDDVLPDFIGDRKGWFGDKLADVDCDQIGSRLWLLAREKITTETIARAREYCVEALQWLVVDKVASRVDVEIERNGMDRIDIVVTVYRLDGTARDLRFADAWEGLNNG